MQGCEHSSNCPFLDRNDERCAQRFNLHQLHRVFGECLNHYERCAIYHQIHVESRLHARIPLAASA